MVWNKQKVTLGNYNEVFKGYSSDTREVIRGAILDDTPLGPYISRFKKDPYMLWQVKLSLDEGVDREWFSILRSGKMLNKVRQLHSKGININPLKKVIKPELSEKYCEYIFSWYGKGVSLERYDFSILPERLLWVFDKGISLGYPMYVFNNGVCFTEEYILSCLKIMSNKRPVTLFLEGDWDEVVLSMLAEYSVSKYYKDMLKYINVNVTPAILEEIYSCCKVGMPLDEITKVDEEGVYIYNKYHISVIREAFLNKYNYEELYNPTLSIADVSAIYSEMSLSSAKKLSGRLRKNDLPRALTS